MMRRAQWRDIPTLVAMHDKHIREAWLPKLGEAFLVYWYRALLQARCGVLLVYEEEGALKGYIFGTTDTRRLTRAILGHQGWGLAAQAFKRLARAPELLGQIWDFLQYEAKSRLATRAELLYIAVDQEKRGGGLADLLVWEALRELQVMGATRVKVATFALNRGANPLLQRLGFTLGKTFTLLHKEFNVYSGEIKEILKGVPNH
jgi:ribosomal protein S18 acetylase RimI-like enzyme